FRHPFEPRSSGPKPEMLGRYTTGLMDDKKEPSIIKISDGWSLVKIPQWLASELVLTRSQATGCRQVRLLHILMGSDIPRRGQPSCRCDALDFEGSQRGGSTDFHRSQEDIKIYKGQL
ncbi:MAG TPA: hypothetical protein VJB08_06470, partial [Candidatus Nanoarchaeia archaeon]|nr:hypothetical protein [Candidatus Nanoarchaeia archaeon]